MNEMSGVDETKKAKIMVVDDLLFTRKMLKDILEEAGYSYVLEVEDGDTAVEAYNASRPDIVLLDVVMPRVDGVTALKQIKEIDPNARVVMISAVGHDSVVKEAINLGAAGYIKKPFQAPDVIRAVEIALKNEASAGPKIMIVDDQQFARNMLKGMLAKGGYSDFLESDNGDIAVTTYLSQRPDVVLLDIVMPVSGMEALKQILASDPNARIIVVTAAGQKKIIKEAMRLGAKTCLIKPAGEDAVLKAVKDNLRDKR